MFITIPVLISRAFEEIEAKEADVAPGKERTTEEIERELEKLLAPYDASTRLKITTRRSEGKRVKRVDVPNYGARFDFWEPDRMLLDLVENVGERFEVEHVIYAREDQRGHEVVTAGSLRTDFFYDALVTPDGRYHKFCLSAPPEETVARRKALLQKHSDCLAVVCKAHI